jgi:branched-chain amino acid transport system permease protein
MNYILHLSIYGCIYAIVAMSLNLVVGYCGLLTLAHAGYFAIGAYTYALASLKLGWGFIPAAGLGMAISAIASLAVSLTAWRFKGDFFVMMSLAVQSLLFSGFYNWFKTDGEIGTWSNLTNGPFGIAGIPKPNLFGLQLQSIGSVALLAAIAASGCAVICWLLVASPWGRLLKAMRDDELVARGLGKNTRLVKVQALAIACGMAALGGAIYAAYVGYIDPSAATLDEGILFVCMVLVGGVGNFRGPLVGALLLIALPEILRFVSIPDAIAANVRLGIYGLLLIGMMHFRPRGLAGEYRIE